MARTRGRATAPKWSPDGRSVYFPICGDDVEAGGCEIFAARRATIVTEE